jgi:hypothetical protein
VPFLIEVAASEETPQPELALSLLNRLVDGPRYQWPWPHLRFLRERLPIPALQAAIRRELRIGAGLRAEVGRSLAPLLPRLRTGTRAVRQQIAGLLARLPEERDRALPALEAALDDALDPATRACVLLAIGWLGRQEPPASRLRAAFEGEADPLVRIVLAMVLLLVEGQTSPPAAGRLVRDAVLATDRALIAAYGDLPLAGADLNTDLATALAFGDRAMGGDVLRYLIRAANAGEFICHERAIAILLLARNEAGDRSPAGEVAPLVHESIEAIARKAMQAGTRVHFDGEVSLIQILRWFGWPRSPFRSSDPPAAGREPLLGCRGRVVFPVTRDAGSIEVRDRSYAWRRLAATFDGGRLERGQQVIVLEYDPARRRYRVVAVAADWTAPGDPVEDASRWSR